MPRLRPGVGDNLVRRAGLLRPLVRQQWAERIVQWNRVEVPDWEHALRGYEAVHLAGVERVADEDTVLVSGDAELCAAAHRLGIAVSDTSITGHWADFLLRPPAERRTPCATAASAGAPPTLTTPGPRALDALLGRVAG